MIANRTTTKFKKEIEKAPKVAASELLKDYDYMGYLTKQGGSFKSWKKRLCVLHSGRLYYYKKKTDSVPKGMINIIGLACDHVKDDKLVSGRPHGLKIISPHRTYYVCADSQDEAHQWLKAINESAALNADYMVHVVDCDKESDVRFHTIEDAVQQANDDDVIIVRSGTYLMRETLKITKPLHLRGVFEQDGGRCLVKIGLSPAAAVSSNEPVIHVQNTFKKSFSLSHLTICTRPDSIEANKKMQKKNPGMINGSVDTDGSSGKFNMQCCIKVSNTCQCVIEDVEVLGSLGQGVIAENDSMVSIQNSYIHSNTQNGLVAMNDSIVAIEHSRMEANGHYGMLLLNNATATVSDCQFSHNQSHAVRHESSQSATMSNNKFHMRGDSPKQREPHVSVKDGCDAVLSGNSME